MKTVNYILVNETGSENAVRAILGSRVSEIRQCIVVDAGGSVEQGAKGRADLISELCRLRRLYPDAKILGVSEIDPSSAHAPIRVNPEMNRLRREMSDLG